LFPLCDASWKGLAEGEVKDCAACGREFAWREKWATTWAQVRYCSDRCRTRGVRFVDEQLEHMIMALLAERPRGATICPSDAARKVFAEEVWRDQMDRVRDAARRLVARGVLEITQRGEVVDGASARGPIRLRLSDRGPR
jgi:hypothetical protein